MNHKYITLQLFSGLLLIGCGAKDDTGVADTSTTDTSTTDTSTTDTSTTDTSTTDTSTTDTSTTGTVTPVEPDFYGLGATSGLYAKAVSADGSYIVGWVSSGHTEAFILSEAGTVMLGDIEGGRDRSIPYAVSSDGSVVVGVGAYGDGSQDDEGVVWNQTDSSILGIGLLSGGIRSGLTGLSDDGTVAVGHGNTSSLSSEAFLWTETSGVVLLGGLSEGEISFAFDVSADGSTVVGGTSLDSGTEAAYWSSSEGWSWLGLLDGGSESVGSVAVAASTDGSVIAGYSNSSNTSLYEAYVWSEPAGMESIGFLTTGDDMGIPTAISGDGSIIVGISGVFSTGVRQAFVWTEAGGIRGLKEVLEQSCGLDLTGWTLLEALDVSTDGTTIVGYGDNPSGQQESWVAVLCEL